MIDIIKTADDYLDLGITALARATEQSWGSGHFGCAAITVGLLAREGAHEPCKIGAICRQFDRLIETKHYLFTPLENSTPNPDCHATIAQALEGSIDRLSPGGHNVIYAALLLHALALRPGMATLEVTEKGVRLLEGFTQIEVQRDYFGIDLATLPPAAELDAIDYTDSCSIAEATFREMLRFEPMYQEIQGIACHLATHAHALILLRRMGLTELARRGGEAHRRHLRQARSTLEYFDHSYWVPVPDRGADPFAAEFWEAEQDEMARSAWGFGHFFKFRYQIPALLESVDDPNLRERVLAHMPDFMMNGFSKLDRPASAFMVPVRQGGH